MKLFNAIQLVTLFAAMPAVIYWLAGEPFAYSYFAFYAAIISYIATYIWIIVIVFRDFDDTAITR